MKTKAKKTESKRRRSNVIENISVRRTRSGYAVFIKGVVFLNDGLLAYIDKESKSKKVG